MTFWLAHLDTHLWKAFYTCSSWFPTSTTILKISYDIGILDRYIKHKKCMSTSPKSKLPQSISLCFFPPSKDKTLIKKFYLDTPAFFLNSWFSFLISFISSFYMFLYKPTLPSNIYLQVIRWMNKIQLFPVFSYCFRKFLFQIMNTRVGGSSSSNQYLVEIQSKIPKNFTNNFKVQIGII